MAPTSRLRRYVEAILLGILGMVVVFSFLSPLRGSSLSDAHRMQTNHDRIEAMRNMETASKDNPQPRWPKVFCMINTIPKNHATRVIAVQDTWANHCDDHIFTTTIKPPIPTSEIKKNIKGSIKKGDTKPSPQYWVYNFSHLSNHTIPHDSREWLWDRLRAAFRRIHREKLADDDTFAVIENLKELLAKFDPNQPFFVISRHWLLEKGRDPNQIYGSGGAGYVLSREAVKRFVDIMPNGDECRNTSYKHEDTEIGECLRNANVTFVDAIDPQNRHSMLPINLSPLLAPFDNSNDVRWAQDTSMIPLKQGESCCSPGLITTHYVKPQDMYTYYFLTYKLQVAQDPLKFN